MDSTKSTDNYEILSQRLIGFFDILGFSDRLRTMDITDLHHLYAELIDDVKNTVFSSEILGTPDKKRKANFDRANFPPAGVSTPFDYLKIQRLLASDPSAQRKYDAPLKWISSLGDDWDALPLFLA